MSTQLLLKSIVLFVLLSTTLVGYVILMDYSSRPGPEAEVLSTITEDELTQFSGHKQGRPTIVLFYHPKCPCTFATVRSLERLSMRFHNEPQIHAVAYCPENKTDVWIESRTTSSLRSLPGSRVHIDREGRMCQQFGVTTSGHILVYDSDGHLTFSGGTTSSRGHEGDCAASQELVRIVNSETTAIDVCTKSPVFGCSILEIEERNSDEG
ncbi:RedB [Thalassoroseus pseudoceratinae]|uniref:RedB n=1 Tax=Thalassoroseus pseudoceratinae TaxID=2713176 RepID=UPI0014230DB8|nr:RedB [Thalassoroseus pseudoceratinae]